MANFIYNTAALELLDGTIDLVNDDIKVMLVDDTYTADPDNDVVDAGGANDPVDAEINTTGYTPGWGNAGRHDLTATKEWTVDKTNDRAEFAAGNPATWTNLGPSGTDIAAALVIKEGGADDTTSRLIAYVDDAGGDSLPLTPNGTGVTVLISAALFHGVPV